MRIPASILLAFSGLKDAVEQYHKDGGEGGGQKGGVGILSQATRDILLILYFTFLEWGGVDFEVYYHII